MAFHHVLATLGTEKKVRVLFADLTRKELAKRFIKPYEKGQSFFSGNDLISPNELRSIQIVRTQRPDKIERDEINRKDLERIDGINASNFRLAEICAGAGYEPQDIVEAGEDITHTLVKGPPGCGANRWQVIVSALGSVASVVVAVIGTVIAAALIAWLKLR